MTRRPYPTVVGLLTALLVVSGPQDQDGIQWAPGQDAEGTASSFVMYPLAESLEQQLSVEGMVVVSKVVATPDDGTLVRKVFMAANYHVGQVSVKRSYGYRTVPASGSDPVSLTAFEIRPSKAMQFASHLLSPGAPWTGEQEAPMSYELRVSPGPGAVWGTIGAPDDISATFSQTENP